MLENRRWSTDLQAEILDREALAGITLAWQALCTRAAEDNVYYSPRYAQALLQTVESHSNLRFAAAWDGPELIGLLPFTQPELALPYVRRVGRAWTSAYTFSGTPLLDATRSTEAAAALIDALADVSEGEWIIPSVNVEGEACHAMLRVLERKALPFAFIGSFQRASLSGGTSFDGHMQHCVPPKRRKELARTRRRLESLGPVEHQVHRFGGNLSDAVEAFLGIEARGWKGERGTALACDARSREFARRAFAGSESDSICRTDVLSLNGTPIAVSIAVLAGTTGFTVKCTYDESYRSFSPGLLLEVEVIRSFLTDRWASRLDAATAGSHVIDSLWPGRVEVADLAFSLDPGGATRLSVLQACNGWTRATKARLRGLLSR